jgi:hypothetical protein
MTMFLKRDQFKKSSQEKLSKILDSVKQFSSPSPKNRRCIFPWAKCKGKVRRISGQILKIE